jgi:hypothetical protein
VKNGKRDSLFQVAPIRATSRMVERKERAELSWFMVMDSQRNTWDNILLILNLLESSAT